MTFKIQKIEPSGVIYADPADPGLSVRIKHSSNTKSLNGVSVDNLVQEVIVNDDVPVTLGAVPSVDAVSIRLRISGTNAALARKKALLAALRATLAAWESQDVFSGFQPETVPVAPV